MGVETIAIAGLVLAAAGTTATVVAQRQQAVAQKKSASEQKRAAALSASRQRRQQIRQARIARGQTLNVAGQTGAEGSGLQGGLSSLGAQVGSNLGFSTQTEGIGRNIARFGRQAASAASFGAIASGVAGLGGALFSNTQTLSALIPAGGGPSGFDPRRLPGGIGAGR